jgi:MFS-type transporter involved in bile tolerance (Atg22 family)
LFFARAEPFLQVRQFGFYAMSGRWTAFFETMLLSVNARMDVSVYLCTVKTRTTLWDFVG